MGGCTSAPAPHQTLQVDDCIRYNGQLYVVSEIGKYDYILRRTDSTGTVNKQFADAHPEIIVKADCVPGLL